MSLTGTQNPIGSITSMEDIYIDSAPQFWFGGNLRYNPDSDGFYWGLTGTAASPVYKVGCYTDFSFKDNVTVNDLQCDAIGVIGVIQTRGYVEVTFTLESILPLNVLTKILRTGTVTQNTTEGSEKMGIGDITNKNSYYKAFFSRVYDPTTGDYVSVTLHRAQFVDAFEIAMPYGDKWSVAVTMRGFGDSTKPDDQRFATVVRVDPSVIV